MDSFPAWLDPEAWSEFRDTRKRMKKPLTDRAALRILNRLTEMKQKGHDPNASLIQSADCYWLDVYPPKDRTIERHPDMPAPRHEESETYQRQLAASIAAMQQSRFKA